MRQERAFDLLSEMFCPKRYSPEHALRLLESYGGILCLQNDLSTSHREGLKSIDSVNNQQRFKTFGKNQQPLEQSLLKRSMTEERDTMVNMLFYLLTLRVCVKLLLFRDEIRGLHPLGNEKFILDLKQEILSYILLAITIFLKAMVNIQYYNMDKDERKYKNELVKVRRHGEIQKIFQKDLMVGDILLVQTHEMVRIDGIVMASKNFMVSEAQTILRQDSKVKNDIWQKDQQESDPFVLAGSSVVTGTAEILVCVVGENCTFRLNKQTKGHYVEPSPMISALKKVFTWVEEAGKFVSLSLATYVSIDYIFTKYRTTDINIQWLDFLHILKVYCGFIGLIFFLQRLKILRSLQFFLETNRSGKFFRVKNRAVFEQFPSLDILFFQSSTIAIRKRLDRDQVCYQLDHINELSYLNSCFSLKIVTPEDKDTTKHAFGEDLGEEQFFKRNQDLTHFQHISSLLNATFLNETFVNDFLDNYLPVFQALKYKVGYVSNSLNEQNELVPNQILHISFLRLDQSDPMRAQLEHNNRAKSPQNFYIKLQNKVVMEDVLLEIVQRSFLYCMLFNTYMSIFINNLIIFVLFCWFFIMVRIVNLYWTLTIVIVQRYLFFSIYRRIVFSPTAPQQTRICAKQFLKINFFLLPYYAYVIANFNYVNNMFTFFLINSLFRVETLLFSISPKNSMRQLMYYLCIFVAVSAVNVLAWKQKDLVLTQELRCLIYCFGLLIIFCAYVIVM